jgi:hypothetical protein
VGAAAALVLVLTSAGTAWAGLREARASSPTAAAATTREPSCDPIAEFHPGNFSNPTRIDSQWLPLAPGTQFVLEGTTGVLPHRVVFTVTDLTKVINGVRTVVMFDVDINEGEVVEAELAFFAQDNAANIWSVGEYPEEFEGGVFVGAPNTWIAGVAGAQAGVLVLGDPRVGTPSYLQGFSPDIGFLDCGKVLKTGEQVCVPVSCFNDVLVVNEWSPLEPGGRQRKYYAPGVGNVQIGVVGDKEGETLVLVKRVRLGARALAKASEAALKLERRAYEVSDVYRQTPPAERIGR